MVLTVYSALSLVTGLSCHHRQRDTRATSLTRCAGIFADLMPASGHRDHTASPSANMRASSCAPSRPSHSAPDTRDDREAPLLQRARNEALIVVILARREAEYFDAEGWTAEC